MSDQVHVVTRATLNCANEAIVTALESPFRLGPMDYLVSPLLTIEVLFVYRKPTSSRDSDFIPVHRLQQAVSHLLDDYPQLTGRLQANSITHAAEIVRFGTGVEFWEAQCKRKLRNIASSSLSGRIIVPHLPGGGNSLLPIFHSTVGSISYNAILAIQHTRFGCGGVSLGIRVNHQVCDAKGFLQLVRDLAEIYRQLRDFSPPTLIFPPEIRSHFRGFHNLSPNGKSKARSFQPSNFYLQGHTENAALPDSDTSKVSARLLRFSGQELADLKCAATDPDPKSGTWVSTFEALSAYLYQRVYQAKMQVLEARGISPLGPRYKPLRGFWTTMDMRDPTRLKLPPRYFPNAVYCPSTYASHENLMRGHLWYIANIIHYAIRSVDMEDAKKEFEWIAAQPDQSRVKCSNDFLAGGFAVSQWTRDNPYIAVDFEVREDGRPVPPSLVSLPFRGSYLVDGLAMILSTEERLHRRKFNGGTSTECDIPYALDVNLALNDLVWPFLEQDSQFVKYIC
ncbi:Transferase [Penicillium soppii]|uniref:Transferase n=1 Tax=Penicillium soppii TaxID=69789 RepID=UPI0025478896|nr:Transferase [Penicillium soppii]KAJ5881553.1 Transferase [Penicillium soppii]